MLGKLFKRVFTCILMLCSISSVVFAQSEFKLFLNKFKEYKWEELPESIWNCEVGDTINYKYANQNIWRGHTNIQRETAGLGYATPSPHIRLKDGSYTKYRDGFHGMFSKGSDSADGFIKSVLYPIARVQLSDDIILLILRYDYFDFELGYASPMEAYTFRLSDEQMISAILLAHYTTKTFIEKNKTITAYESYYFPTDDEENEDGYIKSKCKVIYKIDDDGYFRQVSFEEIEKEGYLYSATVKDADGWANVRETPDVNSKVLFKVLNGKFIYVEKLKDSNWCRILSYRDASNKIQSGGGYIHISRVKPDAPRPH